MCIILMLCMHVVMLRDGSYGPLVLSRDVPMQDTNQRSALLSNQICFPSLTKFSSSLSPSQWCRLGAWLSVRVLLTMWVFNAMQIQLCIFLQYLVCWKTDFGTV